MAVKRWKRIYPDNVISVFGVVIVLFLLIPLPPFLLDIFYSEYFIVADHPADHDEYEEPLGFSIFHRFC